MQRSLWLYLLYSLHQYSVTTKCLIIWYKVFSLFPLFLGVLTLIFFDSYYSMFVYMSLLGLNLGITAPFIGSLWAELYGLESLGSVKALLHACGVFASALSPVIFGYIIDAGFGIVAISVISLVIIIVSTSLPIFYKHIE